MPVIFCGNLREIKLKEKKKKNRFRNITFSKNVLRRRGNVMIICNLIFDFFFFKSFPVSIMFG